MLRIMLLVLGVIMLLVLGVTLLVGCRTEKPPQKSQDVGKWVFKIDMTDPDHVVFFPPERIEK